jgi:hypothetical protein
MISVAHGGPLLGRRSQATRSFGVVVRVQRRRGVTDRQGVVERGLAPGLWMPSQTGDPGLRGSISSSRALLGGFDKLHARKPSLISNAADCSRRKVRCMSILGMWDRGSAMHGASHYRHSKPSTRQSHRPSLHDTLQHWAGSCGALLHDPRSSSQAQGPLPPRPRRCGRRVAVAARTTNTIIINPAHERSPLMRRCKAAGG